MISSMGLLVGCGGDEAETSEGAKEVPPGALVNYHPNGVKKLEEFYSGESGPLGVPLRHGMSTTWDANGSIADQRRYEKGKLVEVLYQNGRRIVGQ